MTGGKNGDPRKARLAEALRANLRKRRDQARLRAVDGEPEAPLATVKQASKTPQSPGNPVKDR